MGCQYLFPNDIHTHSISIQKEDVGHLLRIGEETVEEIIPSDI